MGVAAYNRASIAIREQFDREARPAEFGFIQDLNDMPKVPGAPRPFGPVHFVMGNKGWWALDPDKGSGFHFERLRDAVRAFQVTITGVTWTSEGPRYEAEPT